MSVCNNCGADNPSQAAYCRSCGSSLQVSKPVVDHSQTGQQVANVLLRQRYRIIGPIGSGGMGAVYKAEDTQLGNRLVALKEMSQSGMNAQELQRAAETFRQEATMLARLQHPNLPNIFDHFEENGRWYLVMSFLEGETLKDYLSHNPGGKLSVSEVLQIGIQLCTVLGYLHQQRPAPIIFRDLKPANIMRTSDGHIYLIDFGIARHFKPGQTRDTAYYSSAGYAPPEQYGQAQTTPRSDIYSLGVVLYEMLSGYDPATASFQFPPLRSLVAAIPGELATLVSQMLDLNENRRPADVLVVRQTLQNLASIRAASIPPTVAAGRPPLPPPGNIPPTVAAGRPPASSPGGYQPTVAASGPTLSPPVFPSHRTRRKTGRTVLLASIIGIIIAAGGLIFYTSLPHSSSGSTANQFLTAIPTPTPAYPHLASFYQGIMNNTAVFGTATLTLSSIVQHQQAISGRLTLGPGLVGSGPFTGTVGLDNSIKFTVRADDGSNTIMDLAGTINSQDNMLSGTYGGRYVGQTTDQPQGTWEASASVP